MEWPTEAEPAPDENETPDDATDDDAEDAEESENVDQDQRRIS